MADPRPQATSEKDATPLQHIDKAPDPELVDKTAQSDETTIHPDSPPTHQEAGQPKPIPIASDPASFPDGGTKAWLSVLGCFCSMTVTLGWIQSVGVFQAYYELNQLAGYSHDEVAWIVSLEAFCFFAGGLVVGPLGDAHGPRFLLWSGTLLHVFGLMMASLADKYYQFILAQGLCSAIGTAMLFYPSLSCVVSWFHRRRATAIGIAASGSAVGGVLFPMVIREMIYDVGFPWTMRTCAFLVLLFGVVASLTSTSRLPPTAKKSAVDDIKASFKDVTYMLVLVAGILAFLGQWVVFTFIVTTAIARGVDAQWSFYLVPILNAASFFGRLIPGYLADKTGTMTMYWAISIFTFLIGAGLWIPVSGQAGMVVFAVLFGFGTGGLNALGPAVIAQISDVRMIGLRTGLVYAFTGIGCLFGSPAGGAIISASGYRAMQGFAGAVLGVTAVLTTYIRWRVGGFELRKI